MQKKVTSGAASMRGFTLIEILVVIGIIAVLAAIVIVAINPARQFAQARDTQRTSDVSAILNAVGQNIADNKGVFGGTCSVALPTATTTIGTGGSGFIDLSCLAPTYISALPMDPKTGSAGNTRYTVIQDSTTKRVTVAAPDAEINTPVSITR